MIISPWKFNEELAELVLSGGLQDRLEKLLNHQPAILTGDPGGVSEGLRP